MSKNEFVIDTIANDDADLEDLRALKKVKDEISKKKRALKDKDYLNKHPDLDDLVQKHRRKKISVKEPEAEAKSDKAPSRKVELEVTETKAKVDLSKTHEPNGFNYDELANRIVAKMSRKKKPQKPQPTKSKYDLFDEFEPTSSKKKKPSKTSKEGEAKFNQKLDSIPERVIEPQKTTIASNGKWF